MLIFVGPQDVLQTRLHPYQLRLELVLAECHVGRVSHLRQSVEGGWYLREKHVLLHGEIQFQFSVKLVVIINDKYLSPSIKK